MVCLLSTALFSGAVLADAGEDAVKKGLQAKFADSRVEMVRKTPYGGLYEVNMDGQLFYTDEKVSYFVVGNIIDAKTDRNVTQERMRDLMRVKFDSLPLEAAIKQVKGNGKRKLVVFSDPDCPYCKKLEAELAKVSDVTIYTFLYPLPSLHPQAIDKAKAVWCSADRLKAWDELMNKGAVPPAANCDIAPLAKVAELGARLKVNGTPTLIFADGLRVPGMVPAAELEKLLNGERKK
jgi:thiol:disulfide interchange protein DsbC